MSERMWNRSLLMTAIVVAIISIISIGLAWNASAQSVVRLSALALAPILGAALISYALRTLRFAYFLSRSRIPLPLHSTILVQLVGFALSVTPGRVGEVFKLYLIRERTGTPVTQTTPLLMLDRLTEGGGFMILAILSGLMLPTLRTRMPTPTLIVAGLGAVLVFAVIRRYWRGRVNFANMGLAQSRVWRRVTPYLQNLWRGVETTFTLSQILGGLVLSTLARFADGIVVLFAAQMFGVDLGIPAAVFILAVSGLIGGASFLPAGIGAVETTMAGLLVLRGVAFPNALAIALLARLGTLWLWVALGLITAFLLHVPILRVQFREDSEI